jgi:tetratricopeptide (TPR) repeat protein
MLLAAYALLIVPFANVQKNRPVEVKLGYLPHAQILKVTSGEHRTTTAALIVMRVLFYYGTVIQKFQENVIVRPEFFNLFKTVQIVVDLDPYNMDAYYFAQAVFTWDLGRIREVNFLLEQGLRRRTWDYALPFYLGFNSAYFLKDYPMAAVYMQQAAELSGNPLYAQLAARYFYESEQSSLGLAFLESMISNSKDKAVRRSYELRRDALLATTVLEKARDAYRSKFGRMPKHPEALVETGFLQEVPTDPYGGSFFFDERGQVRTTSKLFAPQEGEEGLN